MGFLRLILALLVLLSHAGMRVFGLNPGVVAVIGFYLISGYVMAGLLRSHYNSPQRAHWFYADRVLRLFPQYFTYALLTVLLWFWLQAHAQPFTPFLQRDPTVVDWLNNILVVPLNYYMVNGSDQFVLLPPAWSLGAELQFYLLVPLMLLWPRVGVVLALASVAVHGMALAHWLNTDWFGYRLIPGVLWVFGVGMLLFAWQRSRPRWAHALALAAPVLALGIYLLLRHKGLHAAPFHQEVLLGWGLGVPLVHVLAMVGMPTRQQAPIAQPAPTLASTPAPTLLQRANHLAGDASYGVFLNHFLLIWLSHLLGWPIGHTNAAAVAPDAVAQAVPGWVVLAVVSVVLAVVTQRYAEQPVLRWRRALRRPRGQT